MVGLEYNFRHVTCLAHSFKVVMPKNRCIEKMFSYDFKTWNDIISRVL